MNPEEQKKVEDFRAQAAVAQHKFCPSDIYIVRNVYTGKEVKGRVSLASIAPGDKLYVDRVDSERAFRSSAIFAKTPLPNGEGWEIKTRNSVYHITRDTGATLVVPEAPHDEWTELLSSPPRAFKHNQSKHNLHNKQYQNMKRGQHENQLGLSIMEDTTKQVLAWSEQQFGSGRQQHMQEQRLLGALEEVGELSHAVLKMQQNIRGSTEQHLNDMRDALGDICIYLADFCGRSGISMRDAYARSLDAPLAGTPPDDTERERWLRSACMRLAACITDAFSGLRGSIELHVSECLRLCESISYLFYGEPIWQVMDSVWRDVVSKRYWKQNATTGEDTVTIEPTDGKIYEMVGGSIAFRVPVGGGIRPRTEPHEVLQVNVRFLHDLLWENCVPKPTDRSETQRCIRQACSDLAKFLCAKNDAYGNSAFDPIRVFSTADALEQIRVRMDDKLSRLIRGEPGNEDTKQDLLGYLVLEKAVTLYQQPSLNMSIAP
jgi:NTP pyrophosphatase (non-canonical NTP hydrolase)